MTTGLFANRRHSQGRAFKITKGYAASARLDAFADLLADGMAPGDAALRLGYSESYGRVMLGRIRKQLGWQAQ